MKIHYGVKNLRSLKSTPEIEIRPITILVGRNSAGKSTFLRSLPLLRQSIETKSSAPILWWGDLVDFGDFSAAVNDGNKDQQIIFSFRLDDFQSTFRERYSTYPSYYNPAKKISVSELKIEYAIGTSNNKTTLNSIKISIPSEDIEYEAHLNGRTTGDSSVRINRKDIATWIRGFDAEYLGGPVFNHPILVAKAKESGASSRRIVYHQKLCYDTLERILNHSTPNNIGTETIQREARRIGGAEKLDAETLTEFHRIAQTQAFKKIYKRLLDDPSSELGQSVFSIHKFGRSSIIAELVEERLIDYFRGVSYIGPVRAASERFYRRQELEVSEISSSGNNFPMFLASLSSNRLNQFSAWVESIFGYGVDIASNGGHISINLKEGNRSVNVTDTGYGVSQILPVLGTIWWSSVRAQERYGRRQFQEPALMAIEQPELHLHPAHQAKLADVFARAVANEAGAERRNPINLLIETHSEALINRIGELIEMGSISPESVQVVIFSAEGGINSPTSVSLAQFDEKGALSNWPFGFFNYD